MAGVVVEPWKHDSELAPPHAQSAWASRGERIRVTRLAVYCNYLSKKRNKRKGENLKNSKFKH